MTQNVQSSTEDLIRDITETNFDEGEPPITLRELRGLDKSMKTIRSSLKLAIAKSEEVKAHIERENKKLEEPDLSEEQKSRIKNRRGELKLELQGHQENINILKGKLSDQITQIKESIRNLLDSDVSLSERIKNLFREQGITIASVLTALGFIISTIVEAVTEGENYKNH